MKYDHTKLDHNYLSNISTLWLLLHWRINSENFFFWFNNNFIFQQRYATSINNIIAIVLHKYGRLVPHQLSKDNLVQRASICASLLFRQKHEPFLDRIVTGDEKWVCYVNVRRRRQWLDPGQKPFPNVKPDMHPKKIMLCIWWDMKGVIYFELLDINQTITANVYSQQLQRLNEVLSQKRPALANQKSCHFSPWQ